LLGDPFKISEREGNEKCNNIFVENPKGKRLFWRTRLRWENNIKKDLKGAGCHGTEWIQPVDGADEYQTLLNRE
jgi:hypothetical protein